MANVDFTKALSPLLDFGAATKATTATRPGTSPESLFSGTSTTTLSYPQRTKQEQMSSSIRGMFGLDTKTPTERQIDAVNQQRQDAANMKKVADILRINTAISTVDDPEIQKRLGSLRPLVATGALESDKLGNELDKILAQGRARKLSPKERAALFEKFTPESIKAYEAGTGGLVLLEEELSPKDIAGLYKDFTPASVKAYAAGTGELVPLEEEEGLSPKDIAGLYKDFTPDSVKAFVAGTGELALRKDPSELTPNEIANLHKTFTPESITAFVADGSPLVPIKQGMTLTPDIKNIMFALGTDDPTDPQVREQLDNLNRSKVRANEGLSNLEERTEAANFIIDFPGYSEASEQYSRARSIIDSIPTVKTEQGAYQLVAAMMGQLYDNDVRAASIIQNFLKQKDIGTKARDWILTIGTGIPSDESIDTLEELAETMKTFYQGELSAKIDSAGAVFKEVMSPEAIQAAQRGVRLGAGLPVDPLLPPQSEPDSPEEELTNEQILEKYSVGNF